MSPYATATAGLTTIRPEDKIMIVRQFVFALTVALLLSACSDGEQGEGGTSETPAAAEAPVAAPTDVEPVEIVPGLVSRKLRNGYGRKALAGDYAEVHYTGWLHDETVEDGRGQKFDSSVDRGQRFQFTLGAGQVIRGWDQGIQGMMVGEVRELTIAPEMAYGERGRGAIPSNATLVFEVELFGLESPVGEDAEPGR